MFKKKNKQQGNITLYKKTYENDANSYIKNYNSLENIYGIKPLDDFDYYVIYKLNPF